MSGKLEKIIIRALGPFLVRILPLKLIAKKYSGIGHILMFHRVIQKRPGQRINNHLSLEITPNHLETIIRYFKNQDYAFWSLDDLQTHLNLKNINKRFVVFTFDDGYVDNYTHAYPIFKKHNIPFTIYVTTDMPDYRSKIWWYHLEDLLLSQNSIFFRWNGKEVIYKIDSLWKKEYIFNKLRSAFNEDAGLIEPFFRAYDINVYSYSKKIALSWEQIKELSNDPLVTIGAHTVTHASLKGIEVSKSRFEISASKEKIEKQIGKKVEHFSFPFGSRYEVGKREFQLVKELGFKTGVTTRLANIFPEHSNYLESLPRISINAIVDNNLLTLLCCGFFTWFKYRGNHFITD